MLDPENAEIIKQIETLQKTFEQKTVLKFGMNDKNNSLREHAKGFENMLTVLEENGAVNPRELTAYQLRAKIEFYEKRAEKEALK